jgi:ESCRT-II complex subunit VPS25
MVKEGKAEYHDMKQKTHVDIYWKSPAQWADIIYQWVNTNGYNGSVLTVYELLEGDTGQGAEFHGMNPELFRKAIHVLNQKGYAELMQGSTAEADGVKFK